MKREDLNGKTFEEVKKLVTDEEALFKANLDEELAHAEDKDTYLKEQEELITKEMEEYDGYLNELEYKLPESCDFDGIHYTRSQVGKLIAKHLDKSEVDWPYALGMYQLSSIWSGTGLKVIRYKPFDSTLRLLGQNKYKGVKEWKEILVINEYFSKCHQDYSIDSSWLYFLSDKHNLILDAMNKLHPQETPEV